MQTILPVRLAALAQGKRECHCGTCAPSRFDTIRRRLVIQPKEFPHKSIKARLNNVARILYSRTAGVQMTLQPRSAGSQLALIVGGGGQVLSAVEMLLDGPRWAVEFVAMNDEPYGTVLAMRPDLVVVNLGLEEPCGFSLLSMLRLDPRTAAIPVLSYVPDANGDEDEDDANASRAGARAPITVGSRN